MTNPMECLICRTSTDVENNWTEDRLVKNEINAYFVVNKLFEISQSTCSKWLGDGTNPSEWVSFCKKCFSIVSDAQKVFSQLVQLEAKWKLVKSSIEKSVCQSYTWEENSVEEYMISNIIRQETVRRRSDFSRDSFIKEEPIAIQQYKGVKWDRDYDSCCDYNVDREALFPHMELELGNHNMSSSEDVKGKVLKLKKKSKRKVKIPGTKSKSSNLKKNCKKSTSKKESTAVTVKDESNAYEIKSHSRSGRAIKSMNYSHDLESDAEEELEAHKPESDDTGGESDYIPDGSDIDNEETNCNVEDSEKIPSSSSTVDSKKFSCKFCPKTFKNLKFMQMHEVRAHSKKHKCNDCEKEYASFYNLRAHIDLHHNTSENKVVQLPYECNKCEFFFKTERLLEFHTKEVHEGVENAYICHFCGKTFSLLRKLRRHEHNFHTEDKAFHCNQCRFATDIEEKLKRHIFTVHESKDPVHCPECKKDMKSQYRLKQHIEMVHKKQRNYVCEHCCASFTQMAALKYHQMGQHNVVFDDLPVSVKCELCGKVVSNPQQLKKHILSVHEKKYLFHCPICNAGRQTKGLIDKHIILAHTNKRPFACSLCDKSYISQGKLDDHFRTHTGEKPFVCALCQKAFSCKKYLEAHEKIHTTEKNFQCDLCPKRFPNAQYLGHHKWYVHQRQKSRMPPKQLVDKNLLAAVATSGGYKKTQILLNSISDTLLEQPE